MKYLFIGGSYDGEEVEVQRLHEVHRLPIRGILKDFTYKENPKKQEKLVYEVYYLLWIQFGDLKVAVFKHDSITPETVLQNLLTKYKKGN